jgi:hypothetical protein
MWRRIDLLAKAYKEFGPIASEDSAITVSFGLLPDGRMAIIPQTLYAAARIVMEVRP